MARYLIHQPGLAPCIVWAGDEAAAVVNARDLLGLTPEQSRSMRAELFTTPITDSFTQENASCSPCSPCDIRY